LSPTRLLALSRNLQTFPGWPGKTSYEEFNTVPLCLVNAAGYVRSNSGPREIVQDSANDRRFVVTALSERQRFAGESIFEVPTEKIQERLDWLAAFRDLREEDAIRAAAASNGISWYILRPSSPTSWPASFLNRAVFQCGGYRVFRFPG
jgi:hypothetical protein